MDFCLGNKCKYSKCTRYNITRYIVISDRAYSCIDARLKYIWEIENTERIKIKI